MERISFSIENSNKLLENNLYIYKGFSLLFWNTVSESFEQDEADCICKLRKILFMLYGYNFFAEESFLSFR